MIYHICPPDILFIKSLVDRFEKIKPGFNRCIIIVSSHHKDSVHNIDKNLIEYFGPLNLTIIRKINASCCQGVVLHTLNDDLLEFILNLSDYIPIIWRSWGPDLHDILYPKFDPLLPFTKKLVNNRGKTAESTISFFRPFRELLSGRGDESKVRAVKKREFLGRIKYIATATQTEFDLLCKMIPDFTAIRLKLNYRSSDFTMLTGLISNPLRRITMIGHSSFSYNNHADILYQLKEEYFTESMILPLCYGSTNYRNKIVKLAKRLFNSNIYFLRDFLKFEDYLKVIINCSSFILNSTIQSGGGNVIYFLYKGSKVYLREENPVYTDFMQNGIELFSIQKELNKNHLLQYELTDEEKIKNKRVIEDQFSPMKEIQNVIDAYKAININV